MNQALQITENVRRKLQLLLERYDALKAENVALKSALAETKAENQLLKEGLDEKVEELRQARMAGALRGSDDGAVEETKSTLAELVREIDKCIALLNA